MSNNTALAIAAADLSYIEKSLQVLRADIDYVNDNINDVSHRVNQVNNELARLAYDFHQFVDEARKRHNHEVAETRLVQIRQKLKMEFGHYKEVRNTTIGILQATDLNIVRKQTITCATEELMLATPKYWLTPCLITIAAWINDQKDLSERALLEGIKRNDEKTSLLFALICRRANRDDASLKWIERYFAMQDPENLDRKCMIMLDAYASGILASDSEGIVAKRINSWLEELSEKIGFEEAQTQQWHDAILLRRNQVDLSDYQYLSQYSETWPVLQDIMDGAFLHDDLLDYFKSIFDRKLAKSTLSDEIDNILMTLVTDYDDEEIPLQKEERENELIVKFKGDVDRAQKDMALEKSSFDLKKSLTQLLTDAGMKPESSHSSITMQRFAIALSRDWILNAYKNVIAKNRANIPHEIEINIENFNEVTENGNNEAELVNKMNKLIDEEKEDSLNKIRLNFFHYFSLWGGLACTAYGILSGFQFILIILGIGMLVFFIVQKNIIKREKQETDAKFEEKRENCLAVLRATLAEVVDFRSEFTAKDIECQKVIYFLKQLSPDQYIRQITGTARKIRLTPSMEADKK